MPFVVLTNTQLVLIQNYIHLQPLREKDNKKKNIFRPVRVDFTHESVNYY